LKSYRRYWCHFPKKKMKTQSVHFAALEANTIAAAIGRIRDRHFLPAAVVEHNVKRIENPFTNDMTMPPP
jgi:hypothetical protein